MAYVWGQIGPMSCTEVLKTRVTSEIKLQAKKIADRELLSEAAWLKRLVVREVHVCQGATIAGREPCQTGGVRRHGREARENRRCGRPMLVRLKGEDRLLLDARAAARGLRPATYVSALTRCHLRRVTPLPKKEFLALKRSISELAAIGRDLNQIARAASEGGRLPTSAREEFRAMLKVCEALRDNTKALLKTNEASWSSGYVEDL